MARRIPSRCRSGCPVSISRLAFFAGIIVIAAVLAPVVASDFIAGFVEYRDSTVAREPDAAPAQKRSTLARQVVLDADPRGHFVSAARINGRRVEVMVDTGASVVALNAETARRLGILPPASAYSASIGTANGVVDVAPVVLSEIRLGEVTIHNVNAAIVPGDVLGVNLLGMSFLGRLSGFEIDKGELVLTQ